MDVDPTDSAKQAERGPAWGSNVKTLVVPGKTLAISRRMTVMMNRCWDFWFERLKEFHGRTGHCHVPPDEDPMLHCWVTLQRRQRENKNLSSDRAKQLATLGFWPASCNELAWMRQYERLEAYVRRHGHAKVRGSDTDRSLAKWAQVQRTRYHRGLLLPRQVDQLAKLGFQWRGSDHWTWEQKLAHLAAYKARHGHCEVPAIYPENPRLGHLPRILRRSRKQGALSAGRIAQLDMLGFRWQGPPPDQIRYKGIRNWQVRVAEFAAFKARYGHCDVPKTYLESPTLGSLVERLRRMRKQGRLPVDQVSQLDAFGFRWKGPRANKTPRMGIRNWQARMAEIAAFKARHGHCDIPRTCRENPSLGYVADRLRRLRKQDKLSIDQVSQLDALGFGWQKPPRDQTRIRGIRNWQAQMAEIAAFKARHGHCDITRICPENPRLGNLAERLRQMQKQGKLPVDQVSQLDALGFRWQRRSWTRSKTSARKTPRRGRRMARKLPEQPGADTQAYWQARLQELRAYKQLHGHCDVPRNWAVNRPLADWVRDQRRARRMGVLSPDRARLLQEAGFLWG